MTMRVRNRDEQGVAMVMTVLIILVAAALVAVVLTQGSTTERHSGRGANWNEALQAADAGIEEAVARLEADNGAVPATDLTGTTADGSYTVKVQHLGRRRYQIDSVGVAGAVQGLRTERHVRVIMAPPHSFKYALFSLTDLSTKNNDIVRGDIWANGSVTIEQNDEVYGNIWAATGFLQMENGSRIEGNVETGGYNASGVAMDVEEITGNAKASSTSPNCSDDVGHTKYRITGGTIGGNASTWNSAISSSVSGTSLTNVCTPAPATKPIPSFTYNPNNYDPSPSEYASVAAFQTYLNSFGSNLSGVHYVQGAGQIDLTGVSIAADTAIIATNATIWANGVSSANNSDKLFVLVSFWQAPANVVCTDNGGNPDECAIGMKNNFQPSDNTATLVYAPNGPVAFKNNAEFKGAAYGANIVIKNNMEVEYDARVDQIVGFGPVTLERDSYIEISD
jgi:hypothetical protein